MAGPDIETEMVTALSGQYSELIAEEPCNEHVSHALKLLLDQVNFVDEASEDLAIGISPSRQVQSLVLHCGRVLARYTASCPDNRQLALQNMTKIFIRRRNKLQEDEADKEEQASKDAKSGKKEKKEKKDEKDKKDRKRKRRKPRKIRRKRRRRTTEARSRRLM